MNYLSVSQMAKKWNMSERALDNAARRYVLVGDKDNAGIYNNAVWNEDSFQQKEHRFLPCHIR